MYSLELVFELYTICCILFNYTNSPALNTLILNNTYFKYLSSPTKYFPSFSEIKSIHVVFIFCLTEYTFLLDTVFKL